MLSQYFLKLTDRKLKPTNKVLKCTSQWWMAKRNQWNLITRNHQKIQSC